MQKSKFFYFVFRFSATFGIVQNPVFEPGFSAGVSLMAGPHPAAAFRFRDWWNSGRMQCVLTSLLKAWCI
jgi:hypothetical protein